jgi:hypothetical protein
MITNQTAEPSATICPVNRQLPHVNKLCVSRLIMKEDLFSVGGGEGARGSRNEYAIHVINPNHFIQSIHPWKESRSRISSRFVWVLNLTYSFPANQFWPYEPDFLHLCSKYTQHVVLICKRITWCHFRLLKCEHVLSIVTFHFSNRHKVVFSLMRLNHLKRFCRQQSTHTHSVRIRVEAANIKGDVAATSLHVVQKLFQQPQRWCTAPLEIKWLRIYSERNN